MAGELYLVRSPYTFLGMEGDRARTKLSVAGIPFDSTNSFRGGSRFAPIRVRLASQSLETYSFRVHTDLELNPPVDEGDVAVVHGDAEATLKSVTEVSHYLLSERRIPFFIGGDHTVTYGIIEGVVRALGKQPCVLIFDAHLDLRNEYLGFRLSHACTTRRVSEVVGAERVFLVGIRAACRDEILNARRLGIKYLTSHDIMRRTLREAVNAVREWLEGCDAIYVSIDMDALDPAYAPGVATPEPEGLTPTYLIDMLWKVIDDRFIGADLVEINPLVDSSDITSFLGAKILIELMNLLNALRKP